MGIVDKVKFWKKDELEDDPFKEDPFKSSNTLDQPDLLAGEKKDEEDNPFLKPLDPPKQDKRPEFVQRLPHQQALGAGLDNMPNDFSQNTNKRNISEFDLIISKLDTLKALVDNVNQRLSLIEEYLKRDRNNKW